MSTDPSYRAGMTVVLATALASLVALSLLIGPEPSPARAGQDLGGQGFPLGAFQLVERSGRNVDDGDFAQGVSICSFIFTRCPLSCPRISGVMKSLSSRLEGTNARLVSISVDPDHDTPQVLSEYARRFDADPNRWWFLTGSRDEVERLVTRRFKLGLRLPSPEEVAAGGEQVLHSERLALVDRGTVVGFFDSTDTDALESLLAKTRERDRQAPAWARRLPAVNASLNGACSVLLLLGWFLARAGRTRAHASAMIASVLVAILFLACYLVYHYQVGSVAFRGVGPIRVVYFAILVSHTLLAGLGVVPLVTLTLVHAARGRFDRHARIARITFPVWLYVSITGVVIYVMLYQLPTASATATL